jgi:hypothetical protein
MPLPGNPDELRSSADRVAVTARSVDSARDALIRHERSISAEWSGWASTLTLAQIQQDADALHKAAEALTQVVAPLRMYAEALSTAQRDHAVGEQMLAQGRTTFDAVGSGATTASDTARDEASHMIDDATNVMLDAEERARQANEIAARQLSAATSLLTSIAPLQTTGPVVGSDGTLGDGLLKAFGDVGREAVDTVTGVVAHLNPFSDELGSTWAQTWDSATTALTHPMSAVEAVVAGTVAPVGDSYRDGGLDEAVGRVPSVLASVVGFKGLTKLEKLRLLKREASTPLAPGGGLQGHEDAGGHTLAPERAHVGADEAVLRNRLDTEPRLRSVSSFFDRAAAERSVAENLGSNHEAIDDWLANSSRATKGFDMTHDRIVGHWLDRDSPSGAAIGASRSRVVLRRDSSSPGGYHVLTSFPIP